MNANGWALLSAPGPAAIAVVGAWGPQVDEFLQRHVRPSKRGGGAAHRAALVDADGAALDDMLVTVQDGAVRLHLHGNPHLVERCGELLTACGLARATSSAAVLWAARDLLEAEALALLPEMSTTRGVQWVLSQAEALRGLAEALCGVDGAHVQQACAAAAERAGGAAWFTRALRIALLGAPNAGKSTLANALAERAVSLVAPTPGTTRDWLEAPAEIAGLPVVWLDTAGLRESADALERAGMAATHTAAAGADVIVAVASATGDVAGQVAAVRAAAPAGRPMCVAISKADLHTAPDGLAGRLAEPAAVVAALERRGLDELRGAVLRAAGRDLAQCAAPAAFTPRQAAMLRAAASAENAAERAEWATALRGAVPGARAGGPALAPGRGPD